MLSRILLLLGLVSTTCATAQEAKKPTVKTTQNAPIIDYRALGSPMPRLKVLVYKDTATVKGATAEDQARGKKAKRKSKNAPAPVMAAGDTTYLTDKDFDNGYNLFVMLFNPTCGHCQDMTRIMENNIAEFKKSKILLMATPMMKQYLGDFTGLLHTSQYPSIHVGVDSSGFVDNAFLYQMLPQINIYNGERKLIKIYTGDVAFDSLRQYIQ